MCNDSTLATSCNISLPHDASLVLDILEANGFEAWCVGGFVRDALLGRPCSDIDIATNASWEVAQRIFESQGFRTHDTGSKHGTITVVVDETAFEVTTYRSDGIYSDGRHPDSVSFVNTIEEDLARRDFTMNALAYHPARGLVDPYDGVSDLREGVIRAVGDAGKRFREDALRILRACRFSSQLGFTIERGTLSAALSCKHLLPSLAAERVRHELDELLKGSHVHDALLRTCDIVVMVLPEIAAMRGFEQRTPYHIYDVLEHTAWVVQHSPSTTLSRWTALFHDMGKPAAFFCNEDGVGHFYGHAAVSLVLAQGIMNRLKFSTALQGKVLTLVKYHDDVIEHTPKAVKRALARLGGDAELFCALCDLKRADALSQAPHCAYRAEGADELKAILADVLASDDAFSLKKLAVRGNDLLALGMEPGPAIGALLDELLEAVIDERMENDRAALIAYAAARIAKSAEPVETARPSR